MKLSDLTAIICILSTSTVHSWFWSSSDSDGDLATEAEDILVTTDEIFKKDEGADLPGDNPVKEGDGGGQKITQQQLNVMNREEFERKLAESLAAHEIRHLREDSHLDAHGEHNVEFDHEAFLGDQVEEFKHLTPEESKRRLVKIVKKIDVDNDTLIGLEELTVWIKETQKRSVFR